MVREQIKVFAGTKKLFHTGVKLVILDEADNMTNAAQFALRRSTIYRFVVRSLLVIEKYSQNTRFCLICNYVSEIIPAVQSRCTRFRFQPLNPQLIRSRLHYILRQEKYTTSAGIFIFSVEFDEDGVAALLSLSRGDMRRVINVLQVEFALFRRDST